MTNIQIKKELEEENFVIPKDKLEEFLKEQGYSVKKEQKTFKVTVCKMSWANLDYELKADSLEEAKKLARELAENNDEEMFHQDLIDNAKVEEVNETE